MFAMLHPLTLAGQPAPHLHPNEQIMFVVAGILAIAWIGYEWYADRVRK